MHGGLIVHSNSKTKQVLDFLRKHFNKAHTAISIHRSLYKGNDYIKNKKEIKTINTILWRLNKKNLIDRTHQGFYVANISFSLIHKLEKPPSELHGIVLGCNLLKNLQKDPEGPRSVTISEEGISILCSLGFIYDSSNKSYEKTLFYSNRRVLITVNRNSKVLIHIGCTNNPLDLPGFYNLLIFLDGFLEPLAPFNNREVVDLLEVGIAKDFKELRLDGVSSVSLKCFTNAWTRIYYHKGLKVTRFEHHVQPKMTLDDALKSLSILTNPVNYSYESKPIDKDNPCYV